eukprot:2996038-Heterocapsa_arctica.AAC.1
MKGAPQSSPRRSSCCRSRHLKVFFLLIFYSLRSLLTSCAADEQLKLLQQVLVLRLHLLLTQPGKFEDGVDSTDLRRHLRDVAVELRSFRL